MDWKEIPDPVVAQFQSSKATISQKKESTFWTSVMWLTICMMRFILLGMENKTPSFTSTQAPQFQPAKESPNLKRVVFGTMREGQSFQEFEDNLIAAFKKQGILKPDGSSNLVPNQPQ